MGDVVGAIPLYLPLFGAEASVIVPKYKRKWFAENTFETIYSSSLKLGIHKFKFEIQKLDSNKLDYPFYCVDIPGLFDREDIYLGEDGHGYSDEDKRNISFQLAILNWLNATNSEFNILHCHDHMTGLIPFFIKKCPEFDALKSIPTVFTIHNGQYRGIFDWSVKKYFPYYDDRHNGLLDWDGNINSLATAIKCSWVVNTVSPSYMDELISDFDTLTPLIENERNKCHGIINGIDNDLWDPEKDTYLEHHLKNEDWKKFKTQNKSSLVKRYNLKSRRPLIGFIGRLAIQKGADILLASIEKCLDEKIQFAAIILGSGDKSIEKSLNSLAVKYPRDVEVIIAYNEKLAREIYAGSDFLMMPSRFEPCGLNQMYSMRYGTVPIVSNVGGLKDTAPDINENGLGIVAQSIDEEGFSEGIKRAVKLFKEKGEYQKLIKKVSTIDYSWNKSAEKYAKLYSDLIETK